jgi:hypothetical protein
VDEASRARLVELQGRERRKRAQSAFASRFPPAFDVRLLSDEDQVTAIAQYRQMMTRSRAPALLFPTAADAVRSLHNAVRFGRRCHVFHYEWTSYPAADVDTGAFLEILEAIHI